MGDQTTYPVSDSEDYGLNEVEDAIGELEEGDHLRLRVSFMTEAAGEQRETFDADVSAVTPDRDDRRVELETPGRRNSWRPPVQADWYIGTSATALREDSHIAYTIESMRVWPAD